MQIRARAVSDLSQLRASRIAHICTEEPIAEEEEPAPTVRTVYGSAHRALLWCPLIVSWHAASGKAAFKVKGMYVAEHLQLLQPASIPAEAA